MKGSKVGRHAAAYMWLGEHIGRHGLPQAFYSDRAQHFSGQCRRVGEVVGRVLAYELLAARPQAR